jgi:hypothetical protein
VGQVDAAGRHRGTGHGDAEHRNAGHRDALTTEYVGYGNHRLLGQLEIASSPRAAVGNDVNA